MKDEVKTRISPDDYFMEFARLAAKRSTCLKQRHGAILVKDRNILATGYNGSPVGSDHCTETGICPRASAKPGTEYERCVAVHAEMNAICQAAKHGINISGAALYVTGIPCLLCSRLLINCGIRAVYYQDTGRYTTESLSLLTNANINLTTMPYKEV